MSRVFWTTVHKYHKGQLRSFSKGDVLPEELASEDSAFYPYTHEEVDEPVEGGIIDPDVVATEEKPARRGRRAKSEE